MQLIKNIFCSKNRKKEHLNVVFKCDLDDPTENSKNVIKILAENGGKYRERTTEDHIFIGRFLSLVLLIESALENIIKKVDPEKNKLMLGQKIDFYKKILKRIEEIDPDGDCDDYRQFIPALQEVKKIRDQFAHNFSKNNIERSELATTFKYIKEQRENDFNIIEESNINNNEKIPALIATFAFLVLERLSFLEHELADSSK
ncbi:MAG: hypothetical protein HOO06_09605 [Bdellovibrionaceae bacterium]|jgi:hypothetical protein|nr:hypothetical protein [Pseudobdellovibrionaceae bacterium]